MKNVRLFYKKQGAARFMSHLDTVRFMTRLLRRAQIPVWYTEGFNPHLYITFALPLSLGMASEYEIADIRILDDTFDIDCLCEILNANSPDGFRFFKAAELKTKPPELCFAEFKIFFDDEGSLLKPLEEFIAKDEIIVEKKTKKGDMKLINIAEDIKSANIEKSDGTVLKITLPAGNNKNVNPELLVKKFLSENGSDIYYEIVRTSLMTDNLKPIE